MRRTGAERRHQRPEPTGQGPGTGPSVPGPAANIHIRGDNHTGRAKQHRQQRRHEQQRRRLGYFRRRRLPARFADRASLTDPGTLANPARTMGPHRADGQVGKRPQHRREGDTRETTRPHRSVIQKRTHQAKVQTGGCKGRREESDSKAGERGSGDKRGNRPRRRTQTRAQPNHIIIIIRGESRDSAASASPA